MKRMIEINGVKLEVDLREATVIGQIKVGSTIKLLRKDYSSYRDYLGVVIGFDAFKNRPTIVVAYIEPYSGELRYEYIHEGSESEIVLAGDEDLPFTKASIVDILNRDINKQELVLQQAKEKLGTFIRFFGKYFEANT